MSYASYAVTTAASNEKHSLVVQKITLDRDAVNKTDKLVKNGGKFVYMNMQPGSTDCVAKKLSCIK